MCARILSLPLSASYRHCHPYHPSPLTHHPSPPNTPLTPSYLSPPPPPFTQARDYLRVLPPPSLEPGATSADAAHQSALAYLRGAVRLGEWGELERMERDERDEREVGDHNGGVGVAPGGLRASAAAFVPASEGRRVKEVRGVVVVVVGVVVGGSEGGSEEMVGVGVVGEKGTEGQGGEGMGL